MALSPLRQCPMCGAKHSGPGQYCAAHTPKRLTRAQTDHHREKTAARGYGSDWRKMRDQKLRRDPLCEKCAADGRIVPASVVHHRDHDERNNDPENHESLCRACHEREHGRKI